MDRRLLKNCLTKWPDEAILFLRAILRKGIVNGSNLQGLDVRWKSACKKIEGGSQREGGGENIEFRLKEWKM